MGSNHIGNISEENELAKEVAADLKKKMHSFALLLYTSLFATFTAIPNIYYVLSSETDYSDCPDVECLTLDQYVQESGAYFTTGSIFIFMVGNHSLETELELYGVSNILLRGIGTEPNTNIVCKLAHAIVFSNTFNINLTGLTFLLHSYEHDRDSALWIESSANIAITNMVFRGSGDLTAPLTRAIYSTASNIKIMSSVFVRNTGSNGGAIYATKQSNIMLRENLFVENKAAYSGGAISADSIDAPSSIIIILNSSVFVDNLAQEGNGGAINCDGCMLKLHGKNTFAKNHAITQDKDSMFSTGGALYIVFGILGIEDEAIFSHNKAREGGAVYVTASSMITHVDIMAFENNSEGALAIIRCQNVTLGGNIIFNTNKGKLQSAMSVVGSNSILFIGITTTFVNNTGKLGGAIQILEESSVTFFAGRTIFDGNSAFSGGAIYCANGRLSFHIWVRFSNNWVDTEGGALYASATNITLEVAGTMRFESNSARNGGGMYLRGGASLNLEYRSKFIIFNNNASDYGGGMYYEDSATPSQCFFMLDDEIDTNQDILPYCFLRYGYPPIKEYFISNDTYNFAGKDGSNLYGGQLDKCRLFASNAIIFPAYRFLVQDRVTTVSSAPYKLCFCDNQHYDCTGVRSRVVHRGQRTNVSLIALAQGDSAVSTFVRAVPSNTAKLDLQQNFQHLPRHCSNFTYTIYSTGSEEQLLLYTDGPCYDTGLARALLEVRVLPCPHAFSQSNEQCVCEERLADSAICIIGEEPSISKREGSMLWFNGTYHENGSYAGLILYSTCPRRYCEVEPVVITLENPDVQCARNRSGILCGACSENHSLLLGSSQCQKCPNTYLALLIPFTLAGIALSGLLIFFRLTVATGMINSVILYTNIVQVNRNVFFPVSATNILTVFVAWMNLDLGFEICFFDGLNEYFQTWLQFAFPLYVWFLISLIIFCSRYSILVSKLIGSDPIAVLATLLLMSYTKILKIVVEVYSSVDLDYPDGKKVTVWLKDANVPYMQSKHLLLTIVTSLVLILFFLPYTLLLLLGHQLYRFSGRKHLNWLMRRIKPLLESYYAPYNVHTRYWTGFLLLVRCALYIVFSYNSLGGERMSLLAIVITFTGITIVAWLSIKIYRKFVVNVIEASVYLNLITLSTSSLANVRSLALTYSLVGLVLITMTGIVAYSFHIRYTAKSALWLKVNAKVKYYTQKRQNIPTDDVPVNAGVSSRDQTKIVSKTHIELREPLLEN